jgi:hypothetical protein
VPSGVLTALPFHLLVTQKPIGAMPTLGKLSPYRDAAWLIKDHSVAILPSLVSLKALCSLRRRDQAQTPLIGFADPVFNPNAGDANVAVSAPRHASRSVATDDCERGGQLKLNADWVVLSAGLRTWGHLFTPRQIVGLTTFADLVGKAHSRILADAVSAGIENDEAPLRDGGTGACAYADAVTPRELEVLAAMADGASNKAIARRLGISFHTAKFHVAAILAKLDAGHGGDQGIERRRITSSLTSLSRHVVR